MERWKEIENTNGDYLISDQGRVKSIKFNRERILKKRITRDGYVWYSLSMNGRFRTCRVNRLVANAFIPNPENKETVNHKDGNKKNNCYENLEWATREEQMLHAYKHRLKKPMQGTLQGSHVLTAKQVIEIRAIYKSHSKEFGMIPLAKKYNVSVSSINKCIGKRSYKNIK